MADITPTGFNLQGIKNSSVVDTTVSTLKDTFKKFSDGLRVYQAKDEGSPKEEDSLPLLELADKFNAHVKDLNRATMSSNDGIAMVQIMDAGLGDIHAGFAQLRELATRSASGTLQDQERQMLQDQAQQIQERTDHIVRNTRYNDIPVLATSKNVLLQTDVAADTQMTIGLRDFSNAFTPVDLTNREGAEAALSFLQEDSNMVYNARVKLAAQESGLINAIDAMETMSIYLTGTGVRIQNADLAQNISNAAAAVIRAYPGIAIQTQANQSAVKVQSLL